jgi:hypothetical protein
VADLYVYFYEQGLRLLRSKRSGAPTLRSGATV